MKQDGLKLLMARKKISVHELLKLSAEHALSIQAGDGSFPSGHNGPYNDPETPVRNTAHWLFLLASLYAGTGQNRWKSAGKKAIHYLLSPEARPAGKTFLCRNKTGKDRCNGLIGQAWVMESLIQAAEAFKRQDCYKLAEEIFLLHPWDNNIGIWHRVEVDGTVLGYDSTFNHQLWFAAAVGLLGTTPEARERTEVFLDKIAQHVQLYDDGVIYHSSTMGMLTSYLESGLQPFLRELKSRVKGNAMKNKLYDKSVGYHGFNLYALAMLKAAFPDAPVWESEKFSRLITAHRDKTFARNVQNSIFGYRYNLSGIEIAYAVETFFQNKKEAAFWVNRQFEETFLDRQRPLSRGVSDPETAAARIYQAARLSEEYEVTIG